jgi:hypothetical protein
MNAMTPVLDETARLRAAGAVSWGAILVGATVAVALTLVLFVLGVGIGFLGDNPKTSAILVAIWLIVTQWLSAGVGGFLTGRLRHRWLATHEHEVFFRDTAHGLAMWAVATVAVALVGTGAMERAGAAHHPRMGALAPMSSLSSHAESRDSAAPGADHDLEYAVAKLFRPAGEAAAGAAAPDARPPDARREAATIVAHDYATGILSSDDRALLAAMLTARGASASEADRRLNALEGSLQQDRDRAEAMRKTAAKAALLATLSLLLGAFIASVAGAMGGRMRDAHA